jgi:ankyrin repeat protein
MRIKSVLYIALLTLSTVALLLSLSIIPFAILPIMITAVSILTVSFGYPWIIGAALRSAASSGSVTFTKIFIALGADVNATCPLGNTPLLMAAEKGHTETAIVLIEKGADVNTSNQNVTTPLHSAALGGRTETSLALIANGANVNATDKYGNTPLHGAAYHDHTETALALIANGANINATDSGGHTPLHLAASYGQNKTSQVIEYPLHWAARISDIKTVKALIGIGYGLQAKLDDKTPLEHAIAADNLNVAKYLIVLTKPSFADLSMPESDNNTTRFLKLATSEHNASALTVGSHATQDQLSKRIQNSKIDFAKALFGMPTTDKAKAMVKFMMFNLTFKMKESYRDAIVIARDLDKRGTTNKGKIRPSLCPDVIGIILNFAGLMPDKTSIDAIAHPYYKALNSSQITSIETAAKHPTLPNTTTANPGPGRPAAAA